MGNIFKIRGLMYMSEWLVFPVYILAVFFLAVVLYFHPISPNLPITFNGYQDKKIFSLIEITILFLFFLVFLIFKMAATFLNNECVRKIPHDINMMMSGLN